MTEALSFVSLEGAIGSSSVLAWAPDGSKFATAYRKAIRIIDASTLNVLTEFTSKHPVKSLKWGSIVDYSEEVPLLVSVGEGFEYANVWSHGDSGYAAELHDGHAGIERASAINGSDALLSVQGLSMGASIWDAATGDRTPIGAPVHATRGLCLVATPEPKMPYTLSYNDAFLQSHSVGAIALLHRQSARAANRSRPAARAATESSGSSSGGGSGDAPLQLYVYTQSERLYLKTSGSDSGPRRTARAREASGAGASSNWERACSTPLPLSDPFRIIAGPGYAHVTVIGSAQRLEACIARIDGKVVASLAAGHDGGGGGDDPDAVTLGARAAAAQPGPLGHLSAVATYDHRLLFLSAATGGLAFEIDLPIASLTTACAAPSHSSHAEMPVELGGPYCCVEVSEEEAAHCIALPSEGGDGGGAAAGDPAYLHRTAASKRVEGSATEADHDAVPRRGEGPAYGKAGPAGSASGGAADEEREEDEEDEVGVTIRSVKTPRTIRTAKGKRVAGLTGTKSRGLPSEGMPKGDVQTPADAASSGAGATPSTVARRLAPRTLLGSAKDPLDPLPAEPSTPRASAEQLPGHLLEDEEHNEPALVNLVPLPQPLYPIGEMVAAQSVPQKNGAEMLRWSPDGRFLAVRNERTPRVVFVIDADGRRITSAVICLQPVRDAAWWWPKLDIEQKSDGGDDGEEQGLSTTVVPRLAILSGSGRVVEWSPDGVHAWHVDGVKKPRQLVPNPRGGSMLIKSAGRWAMAAFWKPQ